MSKLCNSCIPEESKTNDMFVVEYVLLKEGIMIRKRLKMMIPKTQRDLATTETLWMVATKLINRNEQDPLFSLTSVRRIEDVKIFSGNILA